MRHFFSDAWRDGNFLIPANKDFRLELLKQMIVAVESEEAHTQKHVSHVRVLRARIAAVSAYDAAL